MRTIVAVMAGCVMLVMASGAGAQTRPMMPSQGQSSGSSEGSAQQSHGAMMGSGMMGQGMMGHEMGGMMCPMMGQPMMGMGMGHRMMGGVMSTSDPKAMARMLKLRGDIMKAIGEVMVKHAQELEQGK